MLAQGTGVDHVGSTRLRRTIGGCPRRSRWTQGASRAKAGREARYWTCYRAMPVAVAPGHDNSAETKNLPQGDFRLNLRPGRARRLSEAGRHSAPIARQRATREERHSGRTGPTYCNKARQAPPVMGGMACTVAHGGGRCHVENESLHRTFLMATARNRLSTVVASLFECVIAAITCRWRTAASGQPSAALRLMLSRSAWSRRVRARVRLRGTTAGIRNPVGYARPGRRG